MVRVEAVQVDRSGIVCDRYRESRGHWSVRGPAAVTLVCVEDVAQAAAELGVELDPFVLRRNIVVEDVELHALEGRRFRVGETILEGHEACPPCRYLEKLLGMEGLREALRGRGGLRATVVSGGRIRVGDTVEPVAGAPGEAPDAWPEGIRPQV